jgi:hypothetical protein
MIMVEGSDLDIINLKFLLLCFEEMSGLRINFDKSEVVILRYAPEDQQKIADNLNCRLSSFPITYLGDADLGYEDSHQGSGPFGGAS